MGTSPMGVLQLLDSGQVTVTKQNTCCKRVYSVSSYQAGSMLRIKSKGTRVFEVKDTQNKVIAVFSLQRPWFKMPWMEVKLCDHPAVSVRAKGRTSRSTLVMDESDRQILRIKHTRSFFSGKDFKILGEEGIEIGSIRKDWSDYDLLYPIDLDVRFKIAVIASIIFNDIIQEDAYAAAS